MHSQAIIRSLLLALLLPGAHALAQNEKEAQPGTNDVRALKLSDYQSAADKLIQAATGTDFAHKRLAELCDTFRPAFQRNDKSRSRH